VFFLMYAFTITSPAVAQSIPDSVKTKIDRLFARWDNNNSPGCAIGIVMNDSLVYTKGYGMANLEYGLPITPSTIFHMASVSKQFTAYCIVLLAKQGKLNFDDNIRKYLPWFPSMRDRITIRNLLNHTSGIRDQWQLLAISGTRLDDVITQEHIIKVLSEQRSLNFRPGEQYSYSNSGFTMLAEIVGKVSGRSLRQFSDSAIFRPLGMKDTHFHDDYKEIVKNRCYSYSRVDSTNYLNDVLNFANVGATSLFTNVKDMSKWIMNFYNPVAGDQNDIRQLTQKGRLNDGTELKYAMGIGSDTYRGWRRYSHGGADAGYRTNVSVFPDLKMGFIVFSNVADFDPEAKTDAIADLFIHDPSGKDKEMAKAKRDSSEAVLKDTLTVQKFLGNYISEEGMPLNLNLKNSKLYYHVYRESNLLINDSIDTYSIFNTPDIRFVFDLRSQDTTIDIFTTDAYYHLTKYINNASLDDDFLRLYTGTYYCPELDCNYGIALSDHQLWLTNSKYNKTKLTVVNADHLTDGFWWINHLRILRDNDGMIKGFEVNSGRISHLIFLRMGSSPPGKTTREKRKHKDLL
jgi:CubicO group peptidase (beta-lactamase class C family)